MIRKSNEGKQPHDFTLRESFEEHYFETSMKKRTLEAYENMLSHWETLTDNPSVCQISNTTLHKFKNAFLEGYSPSTFNKLRRHILAIMNRLGPPIKGNPEGLQILDGFVYVRKAKENEKLPRVATDEELNSIYKASSEATWPQFEFGAPAWWRAVIVFLYNTGLRRNDFLSLETKEVKLSSGCIEFDAEKTGKDRRLPLHPSVIEHFQAIWSDRKLVFPKPHGLKQLYQQWYSIQAAAEISEENYLTFHQLRSTCGSNLFERSPGAAQEMLGHSSIETTRRSYANMSNNLVQMALTARQPEAFQGITTDDDPDPDILRFPA